MKKILIIIGVIALIAIALGAALFFTTPTNSKKMVCKSKKEKVVIMYNDQTLTGYTAEGIDYDFETQKKYAKEVGIDSYLNEYAMSFSNNTQGKCTK